MTKKQLIQALEEFGDDQELVLPSPEEPAGVSGVAITGLVKLPNGKVKLSLLLDREREKANFL